jgi:hypothetical protein
LGIAGVSALAQAGTLVHHPRRDSFSEALNMARPIQPELFAADPHIAVTDSAPLPAYRPDLDKVRARLRRILAEAQAAKTLPWDPERLSLYRTIFPHMTTWLPEHEGTKLRRQFQAELERLAGA